MPKIGPELTQLQKEALGAAVDGTLRSSVKMYRGRKQYLQFTLPDGREVTRRIISLRRRGFLRWARSGVIEATPEGVHEWRLLNETATQEASSQLALPR